MGFRSKGNRIKESPEDFLCFGLDKGMPFREG